jgi:hypothetical protein
MAGPSLRKAIDDKCKDCIYDSAVPMNWKKQVTLCTSTDCSLHPVRPISRSKAESFVKLQNDPRAPLDAEAA